MTLAIIKSTDSPARPLAVVRLLSHDPSTGRRPQFAFLSFTTPKVAKPPRPVWDRGGFRVLSSYFTFGAPRITTVTVCTVCGSIVTVRTSAAGFMPSYFSIGTTS